MTIKEAAHRAVGWSGWTNPNDVRQAVRNATINRIGEDTWDDALPTLWGLVDELYETIRNETIKVTS